MSNTFYSKELGPQLYPDSAKCPNGMFDKLEDYQAWLETQKPAPVLPSVEEIIADYEARIQARLDSFARTLTYDDLNSMAKYIGCSVPAYAIEAAYMRDAAAETWYKAYELLAAFQPGDSIPAWEEVEAQLPPLAWPEGSRGYVMPDSRA